MREREREREILTSWEQSQETERLMEATIATAAAAAAAPASCRDGDAGSEHPLAAEEWLASRVLERVQDAREVCSLALINRNFWAGSLSDLVWQMRLPPKPVLDAVAATSSSSSKRDLYMHLCKSIVYDDGLKKFWLEPASGRECYMISARGLSIIWGDTPKYWKWKPWPGALFPEVAYLRSVCWFEISGKFRQVLRPGKYMVSFRMQLTSSQAGWQTSPIKLSVENTTYAHHPCPSQVFFNDAGFERRRCPAPKTSVTSKSPSSSNTETFTHPQVREGSFENSSFPEWGECDAGEFLVDDDEGRPIEVHFSMKEIEVLLWKEGLALDGVIIRLC